MAWRVPSDWFQLVKGLFDRLPIGDDGVYGSMILPGLWLDPVVGIQGDLARGLKALNDGLASESHQTFVASLASTSG